MRARARAAGGRRIAAAIAGGVALALMAGAPAAAQPPGPTKLQTGRSGGLELHRMGTFDAPLHVAQPPGSRRLLFVAEQPGRIRTIRDGRVLPRPFLDISHLVGCCGERGLLSVAFSPGYRTTRRLYVAYTDRSGDTLIVEYRRLPTSPTVVDPATRRVVLRIPQPADEHKGGLVTFGPGGHMYIGIGDGGVPGDPHAFAQSRESLLGKILRIDPSPRGGRPYGVPFDNPYVGRPGRDEIYSLGLRNPWRFSFDRPSGTIAIGDVGERRVEEIDLLPASAARGANFGWPAFEGRKRFSRTASAPGHVPPVRTYTHGASSTRCAVTGGYVIRDRRLRRNRLWGRYLYADYCEGILRSFRRPRRGRAREDRSTGLRHPYVTSFGEDNRGRIYVVSGSGPVFRLDPARR